MRRALASLCFIALAASVLAVGVVSAPFTDTAADSGSVGAGDISIRLNTSKGVDEVVWDIPPCVSANMAPGDVCRAYLAVHNDGSVWLEYDVSTIDTTCFDVSFTGPFDTANGGDGISPANAGRLPPGNTDVETISATVTLVGDNACQGTSASVGITVTAESIPTP